MVYIVYNVLRQFHFEIFDFLVLERNVQRVNISTQKQENATSTAVTAMGCHRAVRPPLPRVPDDTTASTHSRPAVPTTPFATSKRATWA